MSRFPAASAQGTGGEKKVGHLGTGAVPFGIRSAVVASEHESIGSGRPGSDRVAAEKRRSRDEALMYGDSSDVIGFLGGR